MLVVETIARIRRDHLVRGVPIKKIARDLRVSKNTVRKVVRGDETSCSYERKIQPMPKLGPWVYELERQLEANEKKARRDRLSLLRIHEGIVTLSDCKLFSACLHEAKPLKLRRAAIDNLPKFGVNPVNVTKPYHVHPHNSVFRRPLRKGSRALRPTAVRDLRHGMQLDRAEYPRRCWRRSWLRNP